MNTSTVVFLTYYFNGYKIVPDIICSHLFLLSAPMPIDTNTSRRLQATSLFSPVLKEDDEEAEKQKEEKEKEKEKELQEKDEAEGEEDAFNPYLFIAGLPPHYLVAAKGIFL